MRTIKRRRKENKTDYLKRLKLLRGNTPRIVFRKTNKYIIAQYVRSREAQDKVEIGINSKQLMNHGWPKEAEGSLKSIPASYLTGFLIGKIILKNKLETPIMDFGINRSIHKTKAYAFLNGLIDAGVEMAFEERTFPEKERIKGEKIKNKITLEEIKSNIEKIK